MPGVERLRAIACLLAGGWLLSCHCPKHDGPHCDEPPVVEIEPSLVFHDPALLASRFPLRKTLEAMVTTANAGGTPESLLQSLLDSFAAANFVSGAGKQVPVEPRPGEAGLSVSELLDPSAPDGMVPTGLFNRFDLAPASGDTCGEYRITYAKKPSGTPGRFLLIFEAVLENPEPQKGLAGCASITDFWAGLSAIADPAVQADRLVEFYYQGLGNGVAPVVTYQNYGVPLGQVRSNLFIGFVEWRLREHRTNPDITNGPSFIADTVKENPISAMFRHASTLPADFDAADQQAFRSHFLGEPVCSLVRPDRVNAGASEFDVVNGTGAHFEPTANDFESVSQNDPVTGRSEDDPASEADPDLIDDITARLAALPAPGISAEQLLNRAGAMTCGGCHQFSNGADLGNSKSWPPSAAFVHIREDGSLSPALEDFLLPRRQQILAAFQCDRTPEPPETPPCPGTVRPGAILPQVDLASLLQRVDEADAAFRAALQGPQPDAIRREIARGPLRVLLEAVQAAREAERALAGAFVPVRRVH